MFLYLFSATAGCFFTALAVDIPTVLDYCEKLKKKEIVMVWLLKVPCILSLYHFVEKRPNFKDNFSLFLIVSRGLVPLHNACSYGHYEVAELLVKHGAVVNVADLWKFTPLHEAAAKGKYEICKLLLQVLHMLERGYFSFLFNLKCDWTAWEIYLYFVVSKLSWMYVFSKRDTIGNYIVLFRTVNERLYGGSEYVLEYLVDEA